MSDTVAEMRPRAYALLRGYAAKPSCSMEPDRTNLVRSYHTRKRKLSAVKPYSRALLRGALGTIDGRSAVGRFLRGYEKMLLKGLGEQATVFQRAMIRQAARTACHLELLDEKVFMNGYSLTQHDLTHYCAWANSLVRTLARIGVEFVPSEAPQLSPRNNLNDILREARQARQAAE